MTSSSSHLTRGYTIALISAVILSTTAIFIRHLTQSYHVLPLVLAFWRDIFVTLTLLIVLGMGRPTLLRVTRPQLVFLVFYGLILSLFNTFWTLSVAKNGAAVATVLVYCSAAFTALLGWWILKERLDWAKLLAVVLCLGGCVLVADALNPSAWNSNIAGILTGVLSGLWYAVYSLMGRSASQRSLSPWTTLIYTFGFAAIYLLGFNLLPGWILPGTAGKVSDFFVLKDSVSGWALLVTLAAGPTVLGFGLYNLSLVHLPSSVANLIATLEPASTAILAYVLLGERMHGIQNSRQPDPALRRDLPADSRRAVGGPGANHQPGQHFLWRLGCFS